MREEPARPASRFDVATHDPEVADACLREAYVDFRRRLHGDPAGFAFTFQGLRAPGFSFAEMHHNLGFDCEAESMERAVILSEMLAGHVTVSGRDRDITPAVHEPYLVTPGEPWRVRWDAIRSRAVTLDQVVLDRAAADLGWQGGQVRFSGCAAVSPAAVRYARAVTEHVRTSIAADDDLVASGLLLAEAARTLAVATLYSFPNNALDALGDPTRRTSAVSEPPAVVRRAVEFIEAEAHRDIGPDDIAAAARVGVRGLQSAFRRYRDQTPTEYLRQVRLEHAHQDLVAGDTTRGDGVAAIAARWGFAHPGRFSVQYRQSYGCSPRDTLRR
ncbi:AraC family transcriptional regulator [Actinomycetospora endophytica]|uniref:AraC family transcriptional regulator n=1 Tax=Actinomycetospora endophytica TaxID=2291215 RepID=A0ABS8PIG1_9PSEU|nr:AraC family transcriptional regulator [Actinomycetospora endophytica]MCD2198053.1 AraC family transcriptional regulator [Actinomycetospora endophytica]